MKKKSHKKNKKTNPKTTALSKPAKKAAAHALKDLGFPLRQVAKILKIDQKTVIRYQRAELEEEWEQFSSTIKKVYMQQDFGLAQMAADKIREKINEARFFELVGLYKTVRDLQREAGPRTAVQVNFNQHIQKERDEFIEK